MTVKRMDNIGILVEDLHAAVEDHLRTEGEP